jgi:uncharacterized protein YjbI with pentapeptide repeats
VRLFGPSLVTRGKGTIDSSVYSACQIGTAGSESLSGCVRKTKNGCDTVNTAHYAAKEGAMIAISRPDWQNLYQYHRDYRNSVGCKGQKLDLTLCQLNGFGLSDHDFSDLVFDQTQFVDCHGTEIDWADSRFRQVTMIRCQWAMGDFANSKWFKTTIDDCEFDKGYFLGAELTETIFRNCRFRAIDWLGAKMVDCRFINCRFDDNTNYPSADIE